MKKGIKTYDSTEVDCTATASIQSNRENGIRCD